MIEEKGNDGGANQKRKHSQLGLSRGTKSFGVFTILADCEKNWVDFNCDADGRA